MRASHRRPSPGVTVDLLRLRKRSCRASDIGCHAAAASRQDVVVAEAQRLPGGNDGGALRIGDTVRRVPGAIYLDALPEVDEYERVWAALEVTALDKAESIEL